MRKEKRKLSIKKQFEPNRLSARYWADAYEMIVPRRKYTMSALSKKCLQVSISQSHCKGGVK